MNQTLAVIAIDIDLTFVIQSILFIFVLAFLWLVIIRDFLKVVDQRAERVEGSNEDAQEFGERADRVFSEYEEKLGQMRHEANEVRDGLKAEGQSQFDAQLDDANSVVEEKLAAGRLRISGQVAEAHTELENRSKTLAKLIADKILSTT
jgi:F-type H+-transporting ATPase subunit b